MSHTHKSQHRHRSPTAATHKTTEMDDSMHSHKIGDNLEDSSGLLEVDTSDFCYPSSCISNGSSEIAKQEDEGDGMDAKTTAVLDRLNNKIGRVRDLIKTEQKLKEGQFLLCLF